MRDAKSPAGGSFLAKSADGSGKQGNLDDATALMTEALETFQEFRAFDNSETLRLEKTNVLRGPS